METSLLHSTLHSKMSLQTLPHTPSRFVWPGACLTFQPLHPPRSFFAFPLHSVSINGSTDNGFKFLCHASSSKPIGFRNETKERKSDFLELKEKIELLGIDPDSCSPGSFDLFYCPKCQGGRSVQRTLSFHISQNRNYALWRCFHVQCGWAGQIFPDTKKTSTDPNLHGKNNSSRQLTKDSLRLEILDDDELLVYFAGRKISEETLRRNNVMQVAGDQKIIAFTYRHNGFLVGCKYRTFEKKYWQERNTDKWLYGLDDIAEADEIIIVEGEIDKLSMEEAGYYNCVSVPSGAPQVVSLKELPSPNQDNGFQYLWNCKEYLDKASRIVLATDGDIPGQSLSEELARRLGKERCWRVKWPKRDEFSLFKDANEVLENLGAEALREAVEKAESYHLTS